MEDRGIFRSSNANRQGDREMMNNDRIDGGGTSVIISVVENRAREICICKIDTINVNLQHELPIC
jgi:hypothetical protein